MDNEAMDRMFENRDRLEEKIREVKRIKDYGITCTTIRESVVYPEMAGMRQDMWLSATDKIQVNYIDKVDSFEMVLTFKEESIIEALNVVTIYVSHWNSELYAENVKIHLEDRQLPILEYCQLCLKLNAEGLELEERDGNDTYNIVNQGVWMNIEKTVEIIKSLQKMQRISIKINKIEGKDNFWHYMSCISIVFTSKYYEDGYLEDLEWRRADLCILQWESENKRK